MNQILLSNISENVSYIDILITSASFEDRCFSIVNSIKKNKYKELWICYNKNEEDFFYNNVNRLREYSDHSTLVEFSTDDPLLTASSLLKQFNEIKTKNLLSVFIDITTFTHEGLLILFKFITIFKEKFKEITLGYTGASDYDVNEKNIENKWLTKGIKSIRSILGYPGVLSPSRKNHLIILFGFESERTEKLINNFEFEKVSLGFGSESDSISYNHHYVNRNRHKELLKTYSTAEEFDFSLTNPYIAKQQILTQINKYPDYNVVIAPMNNKISTIGSALVALEKEEVQLCYVRAHEYNLSGYSNSSEYCYLIPFPNS